MTCHCPAHGGPRPVGPAPFPGSTVEDRFHDWRDALEDSTCTEECGRARNDLCVCRCRGLHHNAGHDYWARVRELTP